MLNYFRIVCIIAIVVYDYIIVGAGAGLSLADRLCDPAFAGLNILVIDKEIKTGNDRTWCSWYKKPTATTSPKNDGRPCTL